MQQTIWKLGVDTAEGTIKKLVIQEELRSVRIATTWITRRTTEPSPLSTTSKASLMSFNGVLLCELGLWGHAGVEGEELWLFTDVLYPIIFMLSGGRNGKHGLNGAFHMWSNSLLTSGCEYQLCMCFLVGLLLSCINPGTRTRKSLHICFLYPKYSYTETGVLLLHWN